MQLCLPCSSTHHTPDVLRYDSDRVSATDLVFVLRSEVTPGRANHPNGVEDVSALLHIAVPNPHGLPRFYEITSRDLIDPNKTLATICASAGWDSHRCMAVHARSAEALQAGFGQGSRGLGCGYCRTC
jgi:hypothetical protein